MSCILKITDPILKPLLDGAGLKSSYSNIDELREAFEGVADKAFVIPLTIRSGEISRRKFGKVYRDEGIKLQIVMPGQEFFNQFTTGEIPLEKFGKTDEKGITLTFDSIDTFLGFYLANYLYVTPDNLLTQGNRKGLVDSIGDILKNTLDRIKGARHHHSRAIEDLKFADALYNYVNLLYNYANLSVPQTISDLYSEIEKKWNQYHTEKKERVNEQAKAEENVEKIKQEEKLQEPNPNANLFFESYDTYPKGNPNEYQVIDKPLSQARRKFLEYLKNNEQDYAIRLMQGATSFPTQTNDQGEYPTKQVIERGVVGIVVLRDDPSKAVYLGKDGLTTEIEQATYIPYEIEGNEMKSPYIPFYFSSTGEHGKLKEEFRKGGEFVFNILNVKEELFKEEGSIGSLGIRVEDIKINSLKGEQYAGLAYIEKGERQIFVDRTTLSPDEVDEVVKLLDGTYEEVDLIKVVEYLNDLLSVSQDEINKGSAGGEIQFFPSVDKIMILPKRIKEGDTYQSVQSYPIYIDEDRELILKSLNAARVRFGRTEEGKLRLGWTKYKMVDGVLNELVVKRSEAVKFYEDHSKVTLVKGSSFKIASFNQRQIQDTPLYYVGLTSIRPDTNLSIGEVNQLIFQPITKVFPKDTPGIVKEKQDQAKLWSALFQLTDVTPRFIFTDEDPFFKNQNNPAFYDLKDGNIYIRFSALKDPSFLRSVLVEELAHAITVPKIKNNKNTKEYKQLEADYKKAKELFKTYKEKEEYKNLTDQQKSNFDRLANYHLSSIEEFVAGISVPYFRAFLRLGESSFLDKVKESIKALLDLILKGFSPSLYTDVTTHVFDFITTKEDLGSKTELVEPVEPVELVEIEPKKGFKFKPKEEDDLFYASAPLTDEVDLQVIKAIDAEIGQYLFQAGQFGDRVVVPFGEFVQGNVKTQALWNRVYNSLGGQLEDSEGERARWIEYFLSNEDRLFKAWQEKSFLFKFDRGEVSLSEDDVDDVDEQENPEEEQSKDPGFNRVDSEQNKTRMELADKYAKVLVRLTPVGYEKGMVKLADFTNLWNRLQTELKNTLSFDEQYLRLSNQELQNRFPEIKTIYDRLTTLKENVTNNNLIVINSFQVSFSTAELPVYVPLFTKTDSGLKYNFFPQPRLDVQHLTFEINRMFREWAEPFEIDEEFPTYDNNKILNKLLSIKINGVARPNDILNLLKGFLPIPEHEGFLTDSNLIEFYNHLVSLFRQRGNNAHILNGQFVDFIRNKQYWENPGGRLGESPGISTQFNQLLSALSKYSALSVSNMTTNAEGQNQSILLSWSSWLIGIKELNQGVSYRKKNPIFKYSLIANNIDADNQIQPVNLSGSRYKDGERYEGSVSMNLDYIPYLRQQFSTFSLDGVIEISRAETKQSSFGYKFNWQDGKHPIKFEKFKSNIWSQDASQIYISNNQTENAKGYLRGELERLKLEKESPNIYYPKYNNIKNEFHLFSYFSQGLKDKLITEEPNEAIKNNRKEIEKELNQHFSNEIEILKENIFKQSGIPFDKNHPSLNVIELQKMILEMGFDNWLRAFVVNQEIYQLENFITGHGDIGQHDKPYKRFGSNISTGTPVAVNKETQKYLENTTHKQFSERIPTGNSFVLKSDIYQFPTEQLEKDNELSLKLYYEKIGIKKSDKEIKREAKENATPYSKTDVSDGQGAMTPDFGRMLMIVTSNWSKEREEGFWFLKIQHKKNREIKLTEDEIDHYNKVNKKIEKEGIYWFFPPLKMQYRGEFIKQGNVAIEGLDKFSLAWLWPDELEDKNFGIILENMFKQGYDYMKYETGTKIGTFIPDNLVEQIKEGKIELTIDSGHSIDLKYMKEQVKASDHFKNSGPMSTQARKLVLSNLKFNKEYLNYNIKQAVKEWKKSQSELSRFNRERLFEEISTDKKIDNKKLADLVSKEVKRRDLPESVSAIFDNYGQLDYERFEQSVSPQLVETLIYSLLRKRIVRPQFPGEQYIQVSSAIYDGSERESVDEIYSKLGNTTKTNNVVIKSVYQQEGIRYAESINGIFSLRVNNSEKHFGNPFSSVPTEIAKGLIATNSTKESVRKYIDWVINSNDERAIWIRTQLQSGTLKGKPIVYYKELGEPSHATALDYLINKYNWNSRDLDFYKIEGDKVTPAQCKIVLSGEFLKLLNLSEINNHLKKKEIKAVYDQLSVYEQLEYKRYILNKLLLIPEFVEKHRRELTVFSSRIPGQGYNSMNIQIVKEFLPTYMGPIIVPNPLITTQSGTDFDFDKLPTITPKLNKEGKASNDPNNRMLEAVESILLDPINFYRLTTPNHTKDIDVVVNNVLGKLGVSVTEPVRDSIFSFSTHLSKWWAMKMKDPLGIGATNNTFYTLIQDSDTKLNPKFQLVGELWVNVKFPFDRDDKEMNHPLLKSGKEKLAYVNQFINITVDVAGNDKIGYTGLRKDNSGLLLFLLENGVSFEDAFYFINQPIIFKYHQKLAHYKNIGIGSKIAKDAVIGELLGIDFNYIDKGYIKDRTLKEIWNDIFQSIGEEKFTNLLDTIGTKPDTPKQREILAYYLVGLEMSNKMKDAQSYNNFDTSTSPNVLYSQARENLIDDIKDTGLFDIKGIEQIHNDSVIAHLNVHDLFKKIAENAFGIKRDPLFMEEALRLGKLIYNPTDKAKFFTKFDNDYLLAILQNYGDITKEKIEKNLKGDLAKGWKKIKDKPEVKELTISKYITENHSSKVNMVSLSLFLGLDNDSETLNQISRDVRTLLERHDTKEWAKQFVETALYSTLFSQSPVYYLKALPHEVVAKYLKEAYDNYQGKVIQNADRIQQELDKFNAWFFENFKNQEKAVEIEKALPRLNAEVLHSRKVLDKFVTELENTDYDFLEKEFGKDAVKQKQESNKKEFERLKTHLTQVENNLLKYLTELVVKEGELKTGVQVKVNGFHGAFQPFTEEFDLSKSGIEIGKDGEVGYKRGVKHSIPVIFADSSFDVAESYTVDENLVEVRSKLDYQKGKVGKVYPVEINYKNPLVIDLKGAAINNIMIVDSLIRIANEKGYDGLVIKNTVDDKFQLHESERSNTYIVFSDKQIKKSRPLYSSNTEFIQAFSNKFIYERGYQFSQYFLPLYKTDGIKNLNRDVKVKKFNPESWRYTDYKLSLEELNEEDFTKPCNDAPF